MVQQTMQEVAKVDYVTWQFVYWFLMPLIFGSYGAIALAYRFAYKIGSDARQGREKLWEGLKEIESNHIHDLQEQINELKRGR